MSEKTLKNVKKDKGFRIFDLIVYGVIILIIAVSFITVFATKDKSPLKNISVLIEDKPVFYYDFESDSYETYGDCNIEVNDRGESLHVKISTGFGYNLIEIEKNGKVRMKEADCHGHDCIYSPEITDNNGIIFCFPHRLIITPKDYNDSIVPI